MSCFSNKNTYLIFGLGITGRATVEFCKKHNLTFFITDDDFEKLKLFDIDEKYKLYDYGINVLQERKINFIILSPHINIQSKPHKICGIVKNSGIEIIADVDLFYDFLNQYNKKNNTNKKMLAITGTNGKSTTTALTTHILNQFNKKAISCGNIGFNCLSCDVEKYDYFVVEISSYTLNLMKYSHFFCGCLLNIAEDHLEYHGNMKNYIKAKTKILQYSENKILCIDDDFTKTIAKNMNYENNTIFVANNEILKNGFSCKEDCFYFDEKKEKQFIFKNLPGKHNVENILSAISIAKICGIKPQDAFEKVKTFNGLKHRIQIVKTINDIIFINDSKATNVNSTQIALKTLSNDNEEIALIAGGERKTLGFLDLKNYLNNVKCVFLIGNASDSFAFELEKMGKQYVKCEKMDVAVKKAYDFLLKNKNLSNNKRIVLLSPLCASFDQYNNFEERGDDFIKVVNNLILKK